MQVQHRLLIFLLPSAEVGHDLIDPPCSQTAAERQDDRAVPCTQLGADGVTVPGLGEHLRTHGVAHHAGLFGGTQLFHGSGHSGEHDVHIRGQQLVGHAGEGVLLMQGGLDAHFGGAAHHRAGHIAAAADDQIGLHLLHHLPGRGAGEGQIPQRDEVPLDVVQRELPLEACDLDVVEGIARLGHQTVLHPLFAAGKMDLGRRVCFFQCTGNGQCGVDMAGCAAGSDQNTHLGSSL